MTCAIHPDQQATAYCRTCGKALCQSCQRDVRGVIYCQDCLAARLEGTVPPAAANAPAPVYIVPGNSVSPGLAAVLGFIPGVGAFYNGQFAKGFVHVFIFAVIAHLANRADIFVLFVFAWIAYMVFDAYTTAKARMLGQPIPDHLGLNALLAGFGLGTQPVHAHAGGGVGTPGNLGTPEAPLDTVSTPPQSDPGSGISYRQGFGGMPMGAVILIGLGVLLLLDNLGVLSFRWMENFWPIALIALGIWLAARRIGRQR